MAGDERSGEDDFGSVNPSGLVYGVLAVATVIAAESTRQETFGKLVAASVVTMVLYWVAHAYSHHWGARVGKAQEWSLRKLLLSLAHEVSILAGAALPIAVLSIEWASGVSTRTAVTGVLWAAAAELVVLEVVASLRQHLSARDVAVQTSIGAMMAGGVLTLRVLLH